MVNRNGYSMVDIYGLGTSSTLSTTEQTIPEDEENLDFNENITDDTNGKKKLSSGNSKIWGAILLFIGITVILHFID